MVSALKHRTETALVKITNYLFHAADSGHCVSVVFLQPCRQDKFCTGSNIPERKLHNPSWSSTEILLYNVPLILENVRCCISDTLALKARIHILLFTVYCMLIGFSLCKIMAHKHKPVRYGS